MKPNTPDARMLSLLSPDDAIRRRFRVPGDLRLLALLTAGAIGIVLVAMTVLRVDTVISTGGTLEPDTRLLEMRGLQPGRVDAVYVRAGDRVREGDLLLRLDGSGVELELAQLELALATVARHLWRDFLEVRAWLAPDVLETMLPRIAAVNNPFADVADWRPLEARIAETLSGLDASMAGVNAHLDAVRGQLRAAAASHDVERAAFERIEALHRRGAISAGAHDEARQRLYEGALRLQSLQGAIGVHEAEYARMAIERDNRLTELVRERSARLDDRLDEHRALAIRRIALESARDQFEVRAPFDAIVDDVVVRSAHEVLSAGTPLLNLRPSYAHDDLLIEIELPSKDAVRIRPGMRFRAGAIGAQRDEHGYLEGRVDFVSLSSSRTEHARMYRVRGTDLTIRAIEVSELGIDHPLLRPGLEVSVDIFVGERRLIDYVIDPVVRPPGGEGVGLGFGVECCGAGEGGGVCSGCDRGDDAV
jgi:multidrug efflux pump subunit AcrA (membrane-fusion protein)